MADFLSQITDALGSAPDETPQVQLTGEGAYRSYFNVTELALASKAAALGEYGALADGGQLDLDRRRALLWFNMTTRPQGWEPGSLWDPIAGDYQCVDGWVRLHTNAPHHQKAAVAALGCAADRDAVAKLLLDRSKAEVEAAVVANNGCAAAMYDLAEWQAHPQGQAVAAEPIVAWDHRAGDRKQLDDLKGLKVLDCTRVLAGPVATRFLAGFGADVLRIDPPHWNEPAVELEVTLGKRCAGLDLTKKADRATFERLLAEADVFVHGYRKGALAAMGYGPEVLTALNPGLIDVSLCAYGHTGPWAGRRGFDSLVQMSSGIAAEGMRRAKADKPVPLPVQALDFATGNLVAAAVLRALRLQAADGTVSRARLSLARTAQLLISGGVGDAEGESVQVQDSDFATEQEQTSWGPVLRVRPPYSVDGIAPQWPIPAGKLRRHEAAWPTN